MSISASLVAQLRRRIFDERVGRAALRFACVDEAATDCLIQITADKRLTTQVFNPRVAQSLSVDLRDQKYDTVKLLAEYLQTQSGYQVIVETDAEPDHPSADLEVVGSMSILHEAVPLKHHLFSDTTLEEILSDACRRHNLSYNIESIPHNEQVFILMLAHAEVNRRLAGDSARRRNIEASAEQLLQVARDLETAYAEDIERQRRAIPVAKFDEAATGQGDVVVGNTSRRSLRNGYFAPMNSEGMIAAAQLMDLDPADVEDVKVTVRWRRNRDERFYAYELWRDTIPQIERPPSLSSIETVPTMLRQVVKKPFTAKLVFRSIGANANKSNVGWATFVEQAGQLITSFVDDGVTDASGTENSPPVEPDTVYYYRLFIIGLNNEIVGSNVVSAKTKSLRALMDVPSSSGPLVPTESLAGAALTLKGKNFHAGMQVTIGGKSVGALVIVNATTATMTAPTFNNPAAVNTRYDVVVTSTTGLRDVYAQGYKYLG